MSGIESFSLSSNNKPKPWWRHLPVLALLLGILSPVLLIFTNFPPPDGVRSFYIVKNILFWFLTSIILLCLLYLILYFIYQLFFALDGVRAFSSCVSIFLLLIVGLVIYFWEGAGIGFFEEDAVETEDASYRLISIGDPDGFPIHYALCECDKLGFQCTCHHIHTRVFGELMADLTLNETQKSLTAYFEDGLACIYTLPLSIEGQNSSYSGYYYSDCR